MKTKFFASNARKALLTVAFSASFLLPALARIVDSNSRMSRIGGEIETFSNLLKNDGLEGSKVASNTDYGTAVGIAYRLRAKFYGVSELYDSENEIVDELKKNDIEYYFVIYEPSNKDSSLNIQSSSLVKVKELQGKTLNLSVYSVR